MKLYYNWFQGDNLNFTVLRDVFDYTVRTHNPTLEIIEEKLVYPEPIRDLRPVHYTNIYKIRKWNEFVQNNEGPFIVCDCDMMCVGDLKEIIEDTKYIDKDIFFTTRSKDITDIRCNAGFIFVKNCSDRVKEFFNKWVEESEQFDPNELKWRDLLNIFKGATQSSLGYIWDDFQDIIGEIPCLKWNATVFEWEHLQEDVKMIHIKSNLRTYILQNTDYENMGIDGEYLLPLKEQWNVFRNEILAR